MLIKWAFRFVAGLQILMVVAILALAIYVIGGGFSDLFYGITARIDHIIEYPGPNDE